MTGCPRKTPRVRPAMIVLLMSVHTAPAIAEDDRLPDMDLLEFLVEWQTADGQWIDPVELDDPIAPPEEGTDVEVSHE